MLGLLCSTVEVFVCLFATPVWFACGKLTLNYLKKSVTVVCTRLRKDDIVSAFECFD